MEGHVQVVQALLLVVEVLGVHWIQDIAEVVLSRLSTVSICGEIRVPLDKLSCKTPLDGEIELAGAYLCQLAQVVGGIAQCSCYSARST